MPELSATRRRPGRAGSVPGAGVLAGDTGLRTAEETEMDFLAVIAIRRLGLGQPRRRGTAPAVIVRPG